MSLVFADDGSPDARTHALVIGIGGYRHLVDGEDEREQVLENVAVLKQLTSPPRSAVAIAEWLVQHGQELRAPLGSLELLVSVAPGDAPALPAGVASGATRQNIQDAYDAWRERCDRNSDNIALFYYCGHGLEKVEHYLLAEDFGASPNNPWLGAFAFDTTRLAFHACAARTQCFFIDACRKLTAAMLRKEPDAHALEQVDHATPECEYDLTIKGSAKNEEAFGPPGEPSYFATALLKALNGSAARNSGAGWNVETGQVAAHITEIMRLVKPSEGTPQRCPAHVTDSTVLLTVADPRVPVILSCVPEAANAVANLGWQAVGAATVEAKTGGPWSFESPPGMFVASAEFAGPPFVAVRTDVFVTPPSIRSPLKCQP